MEHSGNGLASRMPVMGRNAAGVMPDNPALIPLVGNNSRLIILFMAKHSFIHSCDGCVSPSDQPFRLPTIPIYLFTIL